MTDYPGVDPDGKDPGGLEVAGNVEAKTISVANVLQVPNEKIPRILYEVVDDVDRTPGTGDVLLGLFGNLVPPDLLVPPGDLIWCELLIDIQWSNAANGIGTFQLHAPPRAAPLNDVVLDSSTINNIDEYKTITFPSFVSDGSPYSLLPEGQASVADVGATAYGHSGTPTVFKVWTRSP